MTRLLLPPVQDNTNGFVDNDPRCAGRRRTITIRFEPEGNSFLMFLSGPIVQVNEGRLAYGRTKAGPGEIQNYIKDLYATWEDELIGWMPSDPRPWSGTPLTEAVDLTKVTTVEQLDRMWRQLAKAGSTLFNLLFKHGDDGLRKWGDFLARELRRAPHSITVLSDFVAPWAMLYVPDPSTEATGEFKVDLDGFIGYRHLVEHTFLTSGSAEPDIPAPERITAASYVDTSIDEPKGKVTPTVSPVLALLAGRADLHQWSTSEQLETQLGRTVLDDHLIYFHCHCEDRAERPQLRLTDGMPITDGHLASWIDDRTFRHRPLIVLNTCGGGRIEPNRSGLVGKVMLQAGAGSLIGPTISMPTTFAGKYMEILLDKMLRPRTRLGPTIRITNKYFIDKYRNPLGLAYAMYHGMDSHFCPLRVDDAQA